jgi:hypothetical protein
MSVPFSVNNAPFFPEALDSFSAAAIHLPLQAPVVQELHIGHLNFIDHLSKKQIGLILANQIATFSLFSLARPTTGPDQNSLNPYIQIGKVGPFLNVFAQSYPLFTDYYKQIESIRLAFLQAYHNKQDFEICFINRYSGSWVYLNPGQLIDQRNNQAIGQFEYSDVFKEVTRHHMQKFCDFLGANCEENHNPTRVVEFNGLDSPINRIYRFQISWKYDAFEARPLASLDTPPHPENLEWLYEEYQSESETCELTYHCQDHARIKLHSIVALRFGGERMTQKLGGILKNTHKDFFLSEYKASTVRAYVRFLYLGAESLSTRYFKENNIDIYNLLELAHYFKTKTLVNRCVNYIMHIAQTTDAPKIRELSKRLSISHLKQLHDLLFLRSNIALRA